jgi:hypothetical protein
MQSSSLHHAWSMNQYVVLVLVLVIVSLIHGDVDVVEFAVVVAVDDPFHRSFARSQRQTVTRGVPERRGNLDQRPLDHHEEMVDDVERYTLITA